MSKALVAPFAVLIAIAGVLPASAHSWNSGDTAALVGGALLGGIAEAAISNQHRHETQYVVETPRHVAPARPKAAFSPAAGVICYPAHWACYDNNGHFDAGWTNRVY
jgi:hypothetical protein